MPDRFVSTIHRQPDRHEQALGLWVDRIGRHPDATTWFGAFRVLGLHALCAVVSGTGALRLAGGGGGALASGDAWWIPPDAAANYGAAPGTRWTHVSVVFAGPLAEALAGSGLRPRGLVARGAGPAVEEAWRLLVPLMDRSGPAAAAARLAAVATACARFAPEPEDPRLGEAVARLVRHPAGAVDVAALARAVGLGPSQLRRLFQRRYGCAPAAWLLRHRLGQARQLLAGTDLPIATVAAEAGFADPFWFSRVFRREHGRSPAAWRGRAG